MKLSRIIFAVFQEGSAYKWGSWERYGSSCTGACGVQQKVRYDRTCSLFGGGTFSAADSFCGGQAASTKTENCPFIPCPKPEWTPWTDGQCSVSCGGGTKIRTRKCWDENSNKPSTACDGEKTETNIVCNQIECPKNCPKEKPFAARNAGGESLSDICCDQRSPDGVCQGNTSDCGSKFCEDWEGASPAVVQKCSSYWSKCSKTCDTGTQSCENSCNGLKSEEGRSFTQWGTYKKNDPAGCPETEKLTYQDCNPHRCAIIEEFTENTGTIELSRENYVYAGLHYYSSNQSGNDRWSVKTSCDYVTLDFLEFDIDSSDELTIDGNGDHKWKFSGKKKPFTISDINPEFEIRIRKNSNAKNDHEGFRMKWRCSKETEKICPKEFPHAFDSETCCTDNTEIQLEDGTKTCKGRSIKCCNPPCESSNTDFVNDDWLQVSLLSWSKSCADNELLTETEGSRSVRNSDFEKNNAQFVDKVWTIKTSGACTSGLIDITITDSDLQRYTRTVDHQNVETYFKGLRKNRGGILDRYQIEELGDGFEIRLKSYGSSEPFSFEWNCGISCLSSQQKSADRKTCTSKDDADMHCPSSTCWVYEGDETGSGKDCKLKSPQHALAENCGLYLSCSPSEMDFRFNDETLFGKLMLDPNDQIKVDYPSETYPYEYCEVDASSGDLMIDDKMQRPLEVDTMWKKPTGSCGSKLKRVMKDNQEWIEVTKALVYVGDNEGRDLGSTIFIHEGSAVTVEFTCRFQASFTASSDDVEIEAGTVTEGKLDALGDWQESFEIKFQDKYWNDLDDDARLVLGTKMFVEISWSASSSLQADLNWYLSACTISEMIPDIHASGEEEKWIKHENHSVKIIDDMCYADVLKVNRSYSSIISSNRFRLNFQSFSFNSDGASRMKLECDIQFCIKKDECRTKTSSDAIECPSGADQAAFMWKKP